jgi:hypothetical protein
MLDFKIKFMIAVASTINAHLIKCINHLLSSFNVGESGRGEAISRKQGYRIWIFFSELIDLRFEVTNAH